VEADINLVSLDTGARRVVVPGGGVPVRVLPTGHLLVRRNGDVFAVAFDQGRGEVHGAQVGVVQDVRFERQAGSGILDVSDTGTLVYAQGFFGDQERSLIFLSGAAASAVPANVATRAYYDPRLSPDGQRVAVELADPSDDIWIADLKRGTMTRMTFDAGEDETPVWSPDGKSIAYSSSRPGQPRTVFRKAADGSGAEEQVFASNDHSHVEDWSRDGRVMLVGVDGASTHSDIWVVPIGGSEKPHALIQTNFSEGNARLSPDGRWIAYQSDESGRDEVYVQRFPMLGSKAQVSNDGGAQPVWSRDGRQLFYRVAGAVITVPVTTGDALEIGSPRKLAPDVYTNKGGPHTGYDVGSDGRLIFAKDEKQLASTKLLQVVQNWLPELLRRVPVR
jgi:dipeptidyl aminopeptidase/acylaminoacyl peptidase